MWPNVAFVFPEVQIRKKPKTVCDNTHVLISASGIRRLIAGVARAVYISPGIRRGDVTKYSRTYKNVTALSRGIDAIRVFIFGQLHIHIRQFQTGKVTLGPCWMVPTMAVLEWKGFAEICKPYSVH